MKVWIWRIVLVVIALFIGFLVVRLVMTLPVVISGNISTLFKGQIFEEPEWLPAYPRTKISVEMFDEGSVSVFLSLDQNFPDNENLDPSELFIRFTDEQGNSEFSGEQRINGFPFLQTFLLAGGSGRSEFLHIRDEKEFVFQSAEVDASSSSPVLSEMKLAASVPENLPSDEVAGLKIWQILAIGVLMMLGFAYVVFRLGTWNIRNLPKKLKS